MTEITTIAAHEWIARARKMAGEGWRPMDLAGVDRLHLAGDDRFEIVIQLVNIELKERLTVHVTAEGDPPTIPSVVELWPTVDFMEREAFDMFGIVFEGHPNLTRILLPDEWEGYPLRKDYGVGKVSIEFLPQPFIQIEAPGQAPSPVEAGTGVDRLGQSARARPSEDQ